MFYDLDRGEDSVKVKKLGTTTVGLLFDGGVVLATDRRVTAGHFIAHSKGKKIHKIDDNVGMTISGVVADAQAMIDILRFHVRIYKMERGAMMPLKAVATLASNIFFAYRLYPLIADVIIAGVDEAPGLYNIDLFGSLSSDDYISTGSGSPIAYGILEAEYHKGMGADDAVKLAAKAVHYAMRRDSASGDGIDMAVIDRSGYRELTSEEKRRVIESL